jgi:hypothetical protein
LQLTGLTSDQLREWTVRRGLIQPDAPAQKRGSEAKFSWQTVLLLRLACVLRNRFHVELQAHRELLLAARQILGRVSFPGLWNTTLAIYDLRRCELLKNGDMRLKNEDVIVLHLDQHLAVLSEEFGLTDPVSQLPLFPVIAVRSERGRTVKAAKGSGR